MTWRPLTLTTPTLTSESSSKPIPLPRIPICAWPHCPSITQPDLQEGSPPCLLLLTTSSPTCRSPGPTPPALYPPLCPHGPYPGPGLLLSPWIITPASSPASPLHPSPTWPQTGLSSPRSDLAPLLLIAPPMAPQHPGQHQAPQPGSPGLCILFSHILGVSACESSVPVLYQPVDLH